MKASFSPHVLRAAAAAALLAGALAAQPARAAEAPLFAGSDPNAAGITLGSWGAGSAVYTTEEQQSSEGSLRIKIRDFYQGARLDFKSARDLSPVLRQPNAYLAVTLKVGAGTAPAAGPAGPEAMNPENPGMGVPGGMPGGPGAAPAAPTKVSKIRVALFGEKGSYELYPLADLTADATGWAKVGIPLSGLATRLGQDSFAVRRLVIGGDAADTIYVARVTAINDDTEIRAEATASQFNEIHAGDPKDRDSHPTAVTFTATAQGGVTPLKLTWDFDSKDGIQEEAEGAQVEHTFSKPGRYTVTFTAKPMDDAKKAPAVETMEVEVVP